MSEYVQSHKLTACVCEILAFLNFDLNFRETDSVSEKSETQKHAKVNVDSEYIFHICPTGSQSAFTPKKQQSVLKRLFSKNAL